MKLLVDEGANIKATTPQGLTALALSAKGGHLKVVELLLDAKAELNHRDKDGFTPLHWAAQNGHSEVVSKLLDEGANPMLKIQEATNSIHPCDGTAFHLAYTNGHFSAFELLLRNILWGDPSISIFRAIKSGETELAKALTLYQWPGRTYLINSRDEYGRTALFYAVAWGHTDIAASLLSAGADSGVQDNDGRVAADVANSRKFGELFFPSNPGVSAANTDTEADPAEHSECPNLNFQDSHLGFGLANASRCSFRDCAIETIRHNPEVGQIVGFFYRTA
ncbi:ankyrin repeat-containing domain protein [Terfezia claveryi]|nr:ankyrin repeat-containing domain protein [Terfezia claveryi]